MNTQSSTNRLAELDLLRGVAVVLVLLRHPVLPPEKAGILATPDRLLMSFSWLGVDMFLVLSGFLIGGLLFSEFHRYGTIEVKRFLIRRGLKIYPAYIAFILYALQFYYRHEHVSLTQAISVFKPNYFHIQNYRPSPMHHTWTLALEEHFYLMLPLLTGLLVKIGRMKWMPSIALACMIVCNLLRWRLLGKPFENATHAWPTHLRADSLFFGVLLAYYVHLDPGRLIPLMKKPAVLAMVGFVMLLPAAWIPFEHPAIWTIGFTIAYLGCGCILLAAVSVQYHSPAARRFLSGQFCRLLCFIGFYSYSIYLWHTVLGVAPVANWIYQGRFDRLPTTIRWIVATGVYMAIAITAGAIMALLIERPFLSLRDRLYPRRMKNILPTPTN